MKAIILAAGMGRRLDKYAKNKPKCMLEFRDKPLIEWQVEALRECGIEDITIVKGYIPEKIKINGVKYCINNDYGNTNMVHTLFCAGKELEGDVLVCYADIIYEPRIIKELILSKHDVCVAVDNGWEEYWKFRYGNTSTDTESLVIKNGLITELGEENPSAEKISARYIGLLKFSKKGTALLRKEYSDLKSKYTNKIWKNGKKFEKSYMTDLLQHIISTGEKINAVEVNHGWLEFDTNEDYENIINPDKSKILKKLFAF